jgi:hypothetical protein
MSTVGFRATALPEAHRQDPRRDKLMGSGPTAPPREHQAES